MKHLYIPEVVTSSVDQMKFYCVRFDTSSIDGLYCCLKQLEMVGVPYSPDDKHFVSIFMDHQGRFMLRYNKGFRWVFNDDHILVHQPPAGAPPDYFSMPTVRHITDLEKFEEEFGVAQP